MNKRLQGFVAGILCCVLFAGISVFAKNKTEVIEVLYNNIKVYKDNVLCELKDANGTVVEPFIYNGTTYMPVRGTANLADMEVTWDGSTQSVYLWDELVPEGSFLMDVCPPYETGYDYEDYSGQSGKSFKMSGQKFSNGFSLDYTGDFALFNLDSKYSDIELTIGHIDGGGMIDRTVYFYVDGKLVKEVDVEAEGLPKNISIPVNYGLQLKILLCEDNYNGPSIGFGNITVK